VTPAAEGPAVQRRRLRVELRRLRLDSERTQREVAKEMDWSPSKLIRIENGEVGISSNDLKILLDYYGVNDKRRVDQYVAMARNARKESWSEFRDVHTPEFLTYLGFESSTKLIRDYSLTLVPGLLQIEEYAYAIWRDIYHADPATMEAKWRARQRRQELHEQDAPPEMFFILDEAAIRRPVGGLSVMRRQLTQLKARADERHITVQIVPFSRGGHPGMTGPFTVLEFPNPSDDDLVFLEFATGDSVSRDDPEATSDYVERFYELEDIALSPDESAALIDDAITQVESGKPTATTSTTAAKAGE
jgi:transcriptional regulator with XRE-family HTH domain